MCEIRFEVWECGADGLVPEHPTDAEFTLVTYDTDLKVWKCACGVYHNDSCPHVRAAQNEHYFVSRLPAVRAEDGIDSCIRT